MSVEVVRFDDYPEPEIGEEYHGFNLTYTEPGYVVRARYYEHSPDQLSVFPLADPPRQGFGEEIPYADPRLGRAARELLASVPARRLILQGRGVDGLDVEVDPNALAGYAGPHAKRSMQYILLDGRVQRAMKQLAAAIAVIAVLAACGATPSRDPSYLDSLSSAALTAANALPSLTVAPTATSLHAPVPRCARGGGAAFPGVVEARPDGWFAQAEIAAIPHFPNTSGQIYGPDGIAVPPEEGPGRLTLFETFPASDAYFKSRIEQSRKRNSKAIAVTVCEEATQLWQNDSTGELVVGWTDRNKSDVLVANAADFSVKRLVESAESVYDCCG